MAIPRDKFRRDKQARRSHSTLTEDAFVESTFEVALAEMVWRQGDVPMPDGVRQNDRLQGAKEFIKIWRGLSSADKDSQDSDDRDKMFGGGLETEEDELHPATPKPKPQK